MSKGERGGEGSAKMMITDVGAGGRSWKVTSPSGKSQKYGNKNE